MDHQVLGILPHLDERQPGRACSRPNPCLLLVPAPRERAGRAKIAWIVFVMIAASDLLSGWLALPTMAMFPVMVAVYARLAKREEQDALAEFGAAYRDYRARTPAFLPRVHAADNKRQTP